MKQFFLLNSINSALKAQRILNRADIKAYIQKTSRLKSEAGCLYTVSVKADDFSRADIALRRAGIEIIEVFSE